MSVRREDEDSNSAANTYQVRKARDAYMSVMGGKDETTQMIVKEIEDNQAKIESFMPADPYS